MTKFKKIPVIIDAVQWTGNNPREMFEFLEGEDKKDVYITTSGENFYIDHRKVSGGLIIKTKEGEHLASIGDWIIKGIKNEFYPVKPDVFAETYEKVDELTAEDLKEMTKEANKFTASELFEIEKVFDSHTAHVFSAMSVLGIVQSFDDEERTRGQRIFDDLFKTYDCYRTISAKCSKMRQDEGKNENNI